MHPFITADVGSRIDAFAFDKLISNTYPLEKINEAFAASEWHGRDAGTITRAALVP